MTNDSMGPPPVKNIEHAPDAYLNPLPSSPPRPQQRQLSLLQLNEASQATEPQNEPSVADENPSSDHPMSTASFVDGDSSSDRNPNQGPLSDSTSAEKPHLEAGSAAAVSVPYTIPSWSERPCHAFYLEVLKDGTIIDRLDVSEKGAYMFGRVDLCDFVLEHPTVSRFHAVLQFQGSVGSFIYDLSSTHGTFINKTQVKKRVYVPVHVGDVIRFGHSSRLYIFQGPLELMPPERDLKELRNAMIREEMKDCEASLLRARTEASLADGISWGMSDDIIEEAAEDDVDETTWQTYKGQLTEKQEKTRDKIIKRLEKITNMRKEIDAIRAKDISQGGLTQGQQTQIARNEQRISQIMEELDNLEETLNESIQESIGARAGRSVYGKKKATAEDDDEILSDDDEFYDRTKKKTAVKKTGEIQTVETADSLLRKKDSIVKEMEEKKNLLVKEKASAIQKTNGESESGDALDAYMTGLSSQIVLDTTARLQEELGTLQSELERIQYLLKIADPMGEAAQKRVTKAIELKSKKDAPTFETIGSFPKEKKSTLNDSLKDKESPPKETINHQESNKAQHEAEKKVENKATSYTVTKPLWLGAAKEMEREMEVEKREAPVEEQESKEFINYKDRERTLAKVDETQVTESTIENAAPGLIIRKRKRPDKTDGDNESAPELSNSSSAAENMAVDAVALLLKHKRGYFASDSDAGDENQECKYENQTRKENSVVKRVLGPEMPDFLQHNSECDSWVPPRGQSGDGRTSLNDRYGY